MKQRFLHPPARLSRALALLLVLCMVAAFVPVFAVSSWTGISCDPTEVTIVYGVPTEITFTMSRLDPNINYFIGYDYAYGSAAYLKRRPAATRVSITEDDTYYYVTYRFYGSNDVGDYYFRVVYTDPTQHYDAIGDTPNIKVIVKKATLDTDALQSKGDYTLFRETSNGKQISIPLDALVGNLPEGAKIDVTMHESGTDRILSDVTVSEDGTKLIGNFIQSTAAKDDRQEGIVLVLSSKNYENFRVEFYIVMKDLYSHYSEALSGYSSATVTSDDLAELRRIESELASVLSSSDYTLPEETKQNLESLRRKAQSLIDQLEQTADDLAKVRAVLAKHTIDNVSETGYSEILDARDTAQTLAATGNLSADVKNEMEAAVVTFNGWLDRIQRVRDTYNDIIARAAGYSVDTVTADNRQAIDALAKEVNDLLTSSQMTGNLTAEQTASLNGIAQSLSDMQNRIADVNKKFDDYCRYADLWDLDTVSDVSTVALTKLRDDMDALLNGSNLTAAQRQTLQQKRQRVVELLARIEEIRREVDRVCNAVDGYALETVTSDDRTALNRLMADITALLNANQLNMNQEENLTERKQAVEALLARIDAIAEEFDRICAAVDAYAPETVTDDDRTALNGLLTDLTSLTAGTNLTDAQRDTLAQKKQAIEVLLARIDAIADEFSRINAAVDGYTVDTVTGDDKADLERLLADITALENGTNLTSAQRDTLAQKKQAIEALLARIDAIADEFSRINAAVDGYTVDTVTGDDKADLERLLAEITALENGANLTGAQRDTLAQKKQAIEVLLARIDAIADEFSRINAAVDGYTVDTVTGDDKADLERLLADITALENGTNLTSAQRDTLAQKKNTISELLNKIENTAMVVDILCQGLYLHNVDTVRSVFGSDIQSFIKLADRLLEGSNLTAAQRDGLEAAKRHGQALLARIAEVLEILDRARALTSALKESNVKSSDKATLTQSIAELNELLAGDNLSDHEREEVPGWIEKAEALLRFLDEFQTRLLALADEVAAYQAPNYYVTSLDRGALKALEQRIEGLLDGDNLTVDERKTVEGLHGDVQALLTLLRETADRLLYVLREYERYSIDSVKTTQYDALVALYKEAFELAFDGHLNESETEMVHYILDNLEDMIERVEMVQQALEQIAAELETTTVRNVTSDDTQRLQELLANIGTLCSRYSGNLTETEKLLLARHSEKLETLFGRINWVAGRLVLYKERYGGIGLFDEVNLTLTQLEEDLSGLTDLLESDNLTSGERGELAYPLHVVQLLIDKLRTFEQIDAQFTDIQGHWAYNEIRHAIWLGLFNGTDEHSFTPDGVTTRGMFVTVLWRAMGCPDAGNDQPFEDVKPTDYYSAAIVWANTEGIANGTDTAHFAPDVPITREQAATMMFRLATRLGADSGKRAELGEFADYTAVSEYSAEALRWAVAEGLLRGYEDATLRPAANATRAECAALMLRLVLLLSKQTN